VTEAERFLNDLEELARAEIATARKKNADYANSDDPFANFKLCERLGVSIERGMLVRMSDKLMRAANLLDRDPAVADESIDDTLGDLSNYARILRVWLRWKRKAAACQASKQPQTPSLVTVLPLPHKSPSSPSLGSPLPLSTIS
jgi:hypothetical protein